MIQWSRSGRLARSQLESDLIQPQKAHRCPRDVLVLFYACADSSKWGLFGRCARSAFRRTPSGRLTCKSLFLYQRYTKGIQITGTMEYGCTFAIYFSQIWHISCTYQNRQTSRIHNPQKVPKKCSLRQKKQVFLAHIHFFV